MGNFLPPAPGGPGNGILTKDDPAYFADTFSSAGTIANPTAAVAVYPGQLLTMFDASIGGPFAGQEFIAGANLTWRANRQIPGKLSVYNTAAGGDDCAIFARAYLSNSNCVTMQNNATDGYCAMRWVSSWYEGHDEMGAVGFANVGALFYAGTNYLEDNSNQSGFYFVASGIFSFGMEKGTGQFVVYSGGTTTPSAGAVVFRADNAGNVTFAGGLMDVNALQIIDQNHFFYDGTGNQILNQQQPNIPNTTATTAANTTTINEILALLKAHGLMAPP